MALILRTKNKSITGEQIVGKTNPYFNYNKPFLQLYTPSSHVCYLLSKITTSVRKYSIADAARIVVVIEGQQLLQDTSGYLNNYDH